MMTSRVAPRPLGLARFLPVVALLITAPGLPAARAEDVRDRLLPYQAAREVGAVAEVTGRVVATAQPGTGDARAGIPGVAVLLVPHSDALLARLDAVKAGQRRSAQAYTGSAERLDEARRAWEQTLLAAGARDLIRGAVTDEDGRFALPEVPAGRWVLLAWREVVHRFPARKVPRGTAREFPANVERTGYSALTYWRELLTVSPRQPLWVPLSERNEWMTAVREHRRPPEGAVPQGEAGRGAAR